MNMDKQYNPNLMYIDVDDATVRHVIPSSEIMPLDQALELARRYVDSMDRMKAKLEGKVE